MCLPIHWTDTGQYCPDPNCQCPLLGPSRMLSSYNEVQYFWNMGAYSHDIVGYPHPILILGALSHSLAHMTLNPVRRVGMQAPI